METRAPYALIGAFVLVVIGAAFGFVYWLHNTSRQDNIAVQRHTNTIFIRSFPENSNGRSRMPWRLSIRRKQHSLLASLGQ